MKNKVFPGNPSSRKNIVIEAPWSRTIRDDHFVLFENGSDDKIIVFRSNNPLERLCQPDTIYMDGIFDASPRLFAQLYTMHCRVGGKFFIVGLLESFSL